MDLFDLSAKITLDTREYERGISAASKSFSGIGDKLKRGFAAISKASLAAVGAAAVGVSAIVKSAVEAYADYEQLVGGVETLFKDSANVVQKYAADAYKTAGLSANQYMETVTSFSASLLQSLGGNTAKAAQVSDMAITDMADNANKMGTSMEAIQTAYQGFAKQNYTMLDNLKLGYGGTKTEMERLLADAQELSGVEYDISNLSDVYEAIHVIQTEMGITGTTAKEAASTISGSFGMLKASWRNLLVGLGDANADLDSLFGNVVESAETAFKNVVPVVRKALQGMGKLVRNLAPSLAKELPKLAADILPDLLSAAEELVSGLADALPEILNVIIDNLPAIIATVIEIGGKVISALAQAIPTMLGKVWEAVDNAISQSGFGERWQSIKTAVSEAVAGIKEAWDGLKGKLAELKEKFQPVIDKVSEAWQAFKDWEAEHGILEGVITGLGKVLEGIVTTFGAVVKAASYAAGGVIGHWKAVYGLFSSIAALVPSLSGGTGDAARRAVLGKIVGGNAHFGGFAIGNDYVPYDNYPAFLHRGEAVLTAREAEAWRRGNNGKEVVNNFYFSGVSQSDLDYIVGYVNRGLA